MRVLDGISRINRMHMVYHSVSIQDQAFNYRNAHACTPKCSYKRHVTSAT